MSATASTHIGTKGVRPKHKGISRPRAPRAVVFVPVKSIGRNADRHYDPKTGRKKAR